MKDYETQKLIDQYVKEIEKWQNLSRSLMTMSEMLMVDNKIIQFKERIKNLRSVSHAWSKS
ncbi:hypothetical protein [Acinetobacter modestus]|uniref:hypothetical protein n=1 Tax=Acinetobacter modestus TaxID=1776740 RepID=UPI003208C9B7